MNQEVTKIFFKKFNKQKFLKKNFSNKIFLIKNKFLKNNTLIRPKLIFNEKNTCQLTLKSDNNIVQKFEKKLNS